MVLSMTGFGLAEFSGENISLRVEVKSLNSKFLDLSLRIPKALSEREIEIRQLVGKHLVRGKVIVNIDWVKENDADIKQSYNEELFVAYYQQLRRLSDKVVSPDQDIFRLAIQSPDVIVNKIEEGIDEENYRLIKNTLQQALEKCHTFRLNEGEALTEQFNGARIKIADNLGEIEKLDPKRIERVKSRIKNNLSTFLNEENLDENRLEQEIVYYIEKLDISEEIVRLKSHLNYFQQALESPESNGKKLGFIGQEMGREINTIGSKANDAEIQKFVVVMKEELEKIKEQVLNVL